MKKLLLLFSFLCLGMLGVNAEPFICGYVTDSQGQPIANARVALYCEWTFGGVLNQEEDVLYTDNDGYYYYFNVGGHLHAIERYKYFTISADGYETKKFEIDLSLDEYRGKLGVTVEGMLELNFVLEREMQDENGIQGYVRDIHGNPIPNATITLWRSTVSGDEIYDFLTENTDQMGYYKMEFGFSMLNFEYIEVTADGYEPLRKDIDDIITDPYGGYAENNFTLLLKKEQNGLRTIHGVINDPQGNPLEGVEVSATLRALIGDNPIITVTDQDGQYTIDLPEGYFGDMIYWIKASVEDGETMLGSVEEFVPLSEDGDTEVNLTLDEVESLDVPDYRNEYLVLDAQTGEPIEGATVQEFYRHYQHDNGIQKGEMFVTDEMGCYTTDNRISDGFCWHPSYIMVKASGYGTEKVYLDFVLGGDSQGGLEQVIIYMGKKHVGEDAGLVDGINTVNADGKASRHYSVSGVEIAPNAKGLHIVNGKKILVK